MTPSRWARIFFYPGKYWGGCRNLCNTTRKAPLVALFRFMPAPMAGRAGSLRAGRFSFCPVLLPRTARLPSRSNDGGGEYLPTATKGNLTMGESKTIVFETTTTRLEIRDPQPNPQQQITVALTEEHKTPILGCVDISPRNRPNQLISRGFLRRSRFLITS